MSKLFSSLYASLLPSNKPNFLIIGAQKCGTTSLYYYLNQHPNIVGSRKKEIHYFDRDIHFGHSFKKYLKNFKGASNRSYFEATPGYLYHEDAAKNIKKYFPQIKLIVLLRDPVSRAYSAWNHYKHHFEVEKYNEMMRRKERRQGNLLWELFYKDREKFPTFKECIEIELELIDSGEGFEPSLLRRGLYFQQLQNYWRWFKKEQILILGFRELAKELDTVFHKVFTFLDIKNTGWKPSNKKPQNQHRYSAPIEVRDRIFLEEFFEEPNQRLFDEVGIVDW